MTTLFLYTDFFVSLLIMLNPLALIFPFVSMTESFSKAERDRLLKKAIAFSLILLIGVFLVGKFVILFLNLSLYSFIIVGGLFFLKYGYEILSSNSSAKASDQIGVVPIGFPLIAGPGSITLILIYSTQLQPKDIPPSLAVISLSIALTFLLLQYSTNILDWVPKNAIQGISKAIGLIVMVIGIQIILDGITLWMEPEIK